MALSDFLRKLEETSNDTNESKESKCEMFGSFSVFVQLLLGVLAFSILIVKRFIEKPRRPWKIWWFDASKQIISACVVHLINLCLSAIFAGGESSDECVWYFLSVFMDCTLGVFLSYVFMWLVDGISKASQWKLLQSGLYFEKYFKNNKWRYKLKPKMYFAQLGIWLVVTIITKILIVIIIKICKRFLENIGNVVLSPFDFNGKVKLVMVMVIFPLILNAIYFWIVDSILKFQPEDNDKDINELYENEDAAVAPGANNDNPINTNHNTAPNEPDNQENITNNKQSPGGDIKEHESLNNHHIDNYSSKRPKENNFDYNGGIELPNLNKEEIENV